MGVGHRVQNTPFCSQCPQPSRAGSFHRRLRRIRRWWYRSCHRSFFVEKIHPPVPRPRTRLCDPVENEALGLLRMMKASGLVPTQILGLIGFPEWMQKELRTAGINPSVIKRAVEQRRKVEEASKRLVGKREETERH